MKADFPWTLTERETELAEAFIAKHGLAAFLDHLGLDGAGNEVVAQGHRIVELEEALREARPYVFNRVTPQNDEWRSQTATGVLARVDAVLGLTDGTTGRLSEDALREIADRPELAGFSE